MCRDRVVLCKRGKWKRARWTCVGCMCFGGCVWNLCSKIGVWDVIGRCRSVCSRSPEQKRFEKRGVQRLTGGAYTTAARFGKQRRGCGELQMWKVYGLLITTAAYCTRGLSGLAETEPCYRRKESFMRTSRGGWLCSVKGLCGPSAEIH